MFSCTPHSSSPSENPNTNVKLYGQVIEPTIEYGLRCTMYKNVGGLMNMMVISPNKSCDGLPDMLSDPEAKIPVGSVITVFILFDVLSSFRVSTCFKSKPYNAFKEKMWSIVLFNFDNSVAAVPSHWYKNGQCAWPKKYIKNKNKYIERRTATNALEFDFYSARKLNTEKAIDSFKEAKEKARRAQITSDLSSADEQPKRSLGSAKKKYLPPPTFSENCHSIIEWLTDDLVGNTDSSSVVMPVTPTKNIASTSALTEMKCPDDITSNNPISFSIAIPPVTPTSVINHCNYNLYFLDDFQKFVKTSLTNMIYEIKSMAYSIEVLKSLTAQSIENATSSVSTEINTSYEIIWPVNNNDELTAIETLLNDQKIRNNQAIILSRSVGLTIPETVWRIMQRMFSDSFIQKYSYVGFKGKNKFSGLNCCKLLFDSIRKNKKFELLPDIDISSAVSKWMAQAGNRIKKKEEKSNN
ncbi:hypothetical protein ACI65C_006820 [Semiaphis heraclei]